jgi:8-oxo-dGTP diphosphatase
VNETASKEKTHTNGPAVRFVAAALIVRDGQVLIGQRRAEQPMGSLWEFPGGKIEPGESPQEALARELVEELGIRADVGPAVTRIRHNYRRGGAVDLQFFEVREFSGEINNQIYQQVRWVKLEALTDYEFLAADRGLIQDLAAGKLL